MDIQAHLNLHFIPMSQCDKYQNTGPLMVKSLDLEQLSMSFATKEYFEKQHVMLVKIITDTMYFISVCRRLTASEGQKKDTAIGY